MSKFPQWLTTELEQQGVSQTDFAEKIGRSKQTVSDWLQERSQPKPHTVRDISRVLMVDLAVIHAALGWAPRHSPIHDAAIQRIVDKLETVPRHRLPDAERLVAAFAQTFAGEEEESEE